MADTEPNLYRHYEKTRIHGGEDLSFPDYAEHNRGLSSASVYAGDAGNLSVCIYLIHKPAASGERAYYFLLPNQQHLPLLLTAISKQLPFDPEEYGYVIASGIGDVPSRVHEKIRRRYRIKAPS